MEPYNTPPTPSPTLPRLSVTSHQATLPTNRLLLMQPATPLRQTSTERCSGPSHRRRAAPYQPAAAAGRRRQVNAFKTIYAHSSQLDDFSRVLNGRQVLCKHCATLALVSSPNPSTSPPQSHNDARSLAPAQPAATAGLRHPGRRVRSPGARAMTCAEGIRISRNGVFSVARRW